MIVIHAYLPKVARKASIRAFRSVSFLALNFIVILSGCGVKPSTPSNPRYSSESVDNKHDSAVSEENISGSYQATLLLPTESNPSQTLFNLLPSSHTGITFLPRWTPPPKYEARLDNAFAGGGVCIGDVDQDGLPDIFLTRPFGGSRLYKNLGGLQFEDVSEKVGLQEKDAWGSGASFVDIDNDNDLDLYVCGYDTPNRLYVNQGDGRFQEKAASFGLNFHGASVMMAFADYDLDGDLDGYLLTNRLSPEQESRFYLETRNGKRVVPSELQEEYRLFVKPNGRVGKINAAQFDHLYRNNGDGSFTDISRQAKLRGNFFGLSATWWDFNNDLYPDLYVANDFFDPDQLWKNNGDGTFTEVSNQTLPHTPFFSMGSDIADINNDGLLDLMGSDMSGTSHFKQKLGMGDMNNLGWFLDFAQPRQYMRNAVFLNTGTDRFMEVAYMTGLADSDWTWAVKFGDLDNDGFEDLFITNGMTRDWFNSDLRNESNRLGGPNSPSGWDLWIKSAQRRDANMAFKNLGELKFENAGKSWGLDHSGVSFGAALADLDRDGDLDLVVNHFEEEAAVYQNQSDTQHRAVIRLQGTKSNRFGIGALMHVKTSSTKQTKYMTLSRGFMSTNEPVVHLGLGNQETIDQLTILWPSGIEQSLHNLPADHYFVINEPSTKPTQKKKSESSTFFKISRNFPTIKHQENSYDDYARQPLLPSKLSQLGPGIAWADIDGDGDDDFYLSGSRGFSGQLFKNDHKGFQIVQNGPWQADSDCEDMAPLFFDADSDGDNDLYVVSGGVESEPGDVSLQDRLYLNDGTGKFTKTSERVPKLRNSGSVAAACDFDRDGDLDLFIGGRSIPGRYPLTPNSSLLLNHQGKLTDATDKLAPSLRHTGLVTGALWSDADSDGWTDLLVTHEWGPIKYYENQEGRLIEKTEQAGLSAHLGWWNGIAGRDVDGDDDIDYVVTNFGLNTKYHADLLHPALLYYGDFENNGRLRLVEAEHEAGSLFPGRGKSCSTLAMPFLGNKFKTFKSFAQASLADIYSPQALSTAKKFTATTLTSSILINDGKGHFTIRSLPRIAQVAPGFGVTLTEIDGDGNTDLYFVQNFFSPQPETGRMDGGLSQLFLGRGDGNFTPIPPKQSGLVVSGDAKSLTTTDLNDDGRLDFLIGINNDQLVAFENQENSQNRIFSVRLKGPKGNLTAVGARVKVFLSNGKVQTAEVQAGSGYLSQSTATLFFGSAKDTHISKITVRRPDGTSATMIPKATQSSITISYSD